MPLNHTWLLAHIPHQGSMCLLDQVDNWDSEWICCRASSHRSLSNPLRAQNRLGAVCGIEYAAQAMAAHGAIRAGITSSPRIGYLTSVRYVELHVERLDDINSDLCIEAQRLSGDDNVIIYNFKLSASDKLLLRGQATVVLDVAKLAQCI